jgi:hypothetical protein
MRPVVVMSWTGGPQARRDLRQPRSDADQERVVAGEISGCDGGLP